MAVPSTQLAIHMGQHPDGYLLRVRADINLRPLNSLAGDPVHLHYFLDAGWTWALAWEETPSGRRLYLLNPATTPGPRVFADIYEINGNFSCSAPFTDPVEMNSLWQTSDLPLNG